MENTGNKIRNMECFNVFLLISDKYFKFDIATTNYVTNDVDKNHKSFLNQSSLKIQECNPSHLFCLSQSTIYLINYSWIYPLTLARHLEHVETS